MPLSASLEVDSDADVDSAVEAEADSLCGAEVDADSLCGAAIESDAAGVDADSLCGAEIEADAAGVEVGTLCGAALSAATLVLSVKAGASGSSAKAIGTQVDIIQMAIKSAIPFFSMISPPKNKFFTSIFRPPPMRR
ncbi:MAG: hypothetical protein RSC58_05465 [Ruthenibacterium sp.]